MGFKFEVLAYNKRCQFVCCYFHGSSQENQQTPRVEMVSGDWTFRIRGRDLNVIHTSLLVALFDCWLVMRLLECEPLVLHIIHFSHDRHSVVIFSTKNIGFSEVV